MSFWIQILESKKILGNRKLKNICPGAEKETWVWISETWLVHDLLTVRINFTLHQSCCKPALAAWCGMRCASQPELSARVVSVSSVQGDGARSHKDQAARGPGDRLGAGTEITLQNAVQSKHCIGRVSLYIWHQYTSCGNIMIMCCVDLLICKTWAVKSDIL